QRHPSDDLAASLVPQVRGTAILFGEREPPPNSCAPSHGIPGPPDHVERNNLTMRTFMRRFTRLSLGFSKKLENLIAAVSLHFAYYNFCWRNRLTRTTAAMAAGVTDELWDLERLIDESGL